MKFAKWTFLPAGVWGLILLLPQYFLEAKTGRDYPPAITHPEYYYGFIGIAVAFQVLFIIIGTNPVRYRGAMIAAILEKASFGFAVIALFLAERATPLLLGLALMDLTLGALFLIAFLRTPENAGLK